MLIKRSYILYVLSVSILLQLMFTRSLYANDIFKSKISFNFSFSERSNVLEANYMDNKSALDKMHRFLIHNIRDIRNNQSHLSIISHIRSSEKDDLLSINRASIIGSVVRAYLKTKYGLSDSNFSFYIKCDDQLFDEVAVEYKPHPVKPLDNQDIYFAQNSSYSQLVIALLKYRSFPYLKTDVEIIPDPIPVVISPSVATPVIVDNPVHVENVDTITVNVQSEILPIAKEANIVPVYISPVSERKLKGPVFGVSTNIIKWFGITPNGNYKYLPNIGVELYYSKRFSTKIEGLLTPISLNPAYENSGDWCKLSSITLDNKFWFKKDKSYTGFYAGLFGVYGDFDIKIADQNNTGKTGIFFGGGVSVGYNLKILSWLNIEAGLRGIYRYDRYSIYEIHDEEFSLLEKKTDIGFNLYDYSISLILRF